ncbi:MAG: hypothetical protein ACRD2A_14105, partial [Vicinamibacterales bacterium]
PFLACIRTRGTGHGYVFGGVAIPHQEGVTGEQSVTYVAALGGTTVGWSAGAGVFAAPAMSFEAEVLNTGMMTAREPSRYFETYNEERRDRFIGGNVRFHIRPQTKVHLEPVVGLSAMRHEGWTTVERVVFFPQQHVEIEPRRSKDLPSSFGFTTGADLHIGGLRLAPAKPINGSPSTMDTPHSGSSAARRDPRFKGVIDRVRTLAGAAGQR